MKKLITLLALCCATIILNAQSVGINTVPAASAALDVSSTTKGMLVPRMTTAQRDAIASPTTGLMVYNTTVNAFQFYNGTAWSAVGASNSTQLLNANFGHGTTSIAASFISPLAAGQATSPTANTCIYANTGATINVTFYTFDDEGITFEVFEVIPINNLNTYSTSGAALASCNTGVWTSGAAITASLNYTITAGKLYTIKVRPTAGGNFSTNSGYINSFYTN